VKLLLDTHVLLWWLDNPKQISPKARDAISDENNLVFVSAAVVWEIVIKKALDKLEAPDNLSEVVAENRFEPLAITIEHALAVEKLPSYHRDPFDRMQIAQAMVEGMTIVTRDTDIAKYVVPQLRA
jgi:PIN domain nuclease of toxin-antitoxin system